jgi:nicotinate-nucleotide--dimethylbenzimidazole phosphoribosyltransferase
VAAEVLIAALTGAEPVKVLPRGAALPPDVWMARAEQVRDGRRRALPLRDSPAELLSAIDDPDIVAATAFLLRTAARRTPMLLDGLAAAAAALVAHNVQARAARWWRMADASGHPAQDAVLAVFGQQAVLGLGTGMDDGTAGLLAAQVARTAVLTAIPGEV